MLWCTHGLQFTKFYLGSINKIGIEPAAILFGLRDAAVAVLHLLPGAVERALIVHKIIYIAGVLKGIHAFINTQFLFDMMLPCFAAGNIVSKIGPG